MNLQHYDEQDITWVEARDHREQVVGRFGVASDLVLGDLSHVDGWSVNWSTVAVDAPHLKGVSALPVVLVNVPDYPSDHSVTLMFVPQDAKRFAALLAQTAAEAEREMARMMHVKVAAEERRRREQEYRKHENEATRCAFDGCKKRRQFFDEDGRGYCKLHADQLGIRPKGKV